MPENNSNEKNVKNLICIVALIYFPFVVNSLIKDYKSDKDLNDDYWYDEYNLTKEDLEMIRTYKKAWYFMIIFTLILAVLFWIYWFYSFTVLYYINNILLILVIFYLFYNLFLIFSDNKALLFTKWDVKNINVSKVNSWNVQYVFSYFPFMNFYLFSSKNYPEEQDYRLRESNFIYLIWSLIGILSFFINWFLFLFYIILFFVLIRVLSLLFGFDFLPDFVKKNIYKSYNKNPLEIFVYLSAWFSFIFENFFIYLKKKKTFNYNYFVERSKKNAQLNLEIKNLLKNWKKNIYFILSYIVFVWIIFFLLWQTFNTQYVVIYWFSIFILLWYFLIQYLNNKKLVFIPIISSLLIIITGKFN